MINIYIKKFFIVLILMIYPTIGVNASEEGKVLRDSNIHETFISCKDDTLSLCLDGVYFSREIDTLLIMFYFSPDDTFEKQGITIENAMEQGMLLLLNMYNPEANIMLGGTGELGVDFSVEPYNKKSIAVGMISNYKNKLYSGYYRVDIDVVKSFGLKVAETNETPMDLMKKYLLK